MKVARRGWMKSITGTAPAPRLVTAPLPSKAAASGAQNPRLLTLEHGRPTPLEEGAQALASVGSVSQMTGWICRAEGRSGASLSFSDSDSGCRS